VDEVLRPLGYELKELAVPSQLLEVRVDPERPVLEDWGPSMGLMSWEVDNTPSSVRNSLTSL